MTMSIPLGIHWVRPGWQWSCGVVCALVAWVAASAHGDDWPQFRGPASNSAVAAGQLPAEWVEGRMTSWQADLPGRGPASPIVVGGRVIVTASSGANQDRLHVLVFDAADGKLAWQRQFWATGRTITHPSSAVAAPTPASDGKRIFAFFSSNDLVALDFDGNLLWYRGLGQDYPRAGNDVGMASSPLVIDETVIVQSESQGDAFVAGIDVRDGSTRWRVDRDKEASWTSPVALPAAPGAGSVLVQSSKELSCLEATTGKERWSYKAACDGIASLCVQNDLILLPAEGVTALRTNTSATAPEVVWKNNQLAPGAASLIAADGRLFLINRSGVLIAADQKTGQILTRSRLEGSFWGTPVLAGERLLAVAQDGNAQLLEFGEDFRSAKTAVKIPLGETVQASPAAIGGAVYLRSDRHLWKLASPAQ